MAKLSARKRSELPDSAFAYIDTKGRRRLPIYDEPHVKNALARFNQVKFENNAARVKARKKLLNAAKKFGIVPIGFMDGQLQAEKAHAISQFKAAQVRNLPVGLVTFMMTDIEGSTLLLRQLGDRYGELLSEVREIIRATILQKQGHEIDARADEYFAVFEDATHAIEAGMHIQHLLVAKEWPDELDVRIRMGIHSGEPTLTDTGYIGLCVHTAARVSAAAHGGQIVISDDTFSMIKEKTFEGISFHNLGHYQLAGLEEASLLYQLEADGLLNSFPPLRAKIFEI